MRNDRVAEVIGGLVLELRRTSHGAPHGLSDDEWDAVLLRIAVGMHLWQQRERSPSDPNDEADAVASARESLELLSRWWPDLWD